MSAVEEHAGLLEWNRCFIFGVQKHLSDNGGLSAEISWNLHPETQATVGMTPLFFPLSGLPLPTVSP